MLVIADVIENSPQANWLNTFVNKYNNNGHRGRSFSDKDSQLLKHNCFNVNTSIQNYNWTFVDDYDLVKFYKLLFGLDLCKDDEFLLNNIKYYLPYNNTCNKITISWKLLYFNCTK